MGLFGGDDKKEDPANPPADGGGKICPNCGKELGPGEGIRRENGHFCCDKCCEAGDRKEEKEKQSKSKTCEFC